MIDGVVDAGEAVNLMAKRGCEAKHPLTDNRLVGRSLYRHGFNTFPNFVETMCQLFVGVFIHYFRHDFSQLLFVGEIKLIL